MNVGFEWRKPVQGTVLLVEDSKTIAAVLAGALTRELSVQCVTAYSLQQAQDLVSSGQYQFDVAVLDLVLPDARKGEVVDYVVSQGLSPVVFTGEISDEIRTSMWEKQIADYIIKDGGNNLRQVISIVYRLLANVGQRVLVVDDSAGARSLFKRLLERWNFAVDEAENGQEGLDLLSLHGNYSLIITDYEMPVMGGVDFVRQVRRLYPKQEVPILGISAATSASTSAFFLKAGANDFLHKPFEAEEFYCRVAQRIETLEYVRAVRNLAERDPLTGLYNRRSFFHLGRNALEEACKDGLGVALAMIDIDHFKKCNDTYGHDGGDVVIKDVATRLQESFGAQGIVARIGGEEFCVVLYNTDAETAHQALETFRVRQEQHTTAFGDRQIAVTSSIGLCTDCSIGLDTMMQRADKALYEAKNKGRNKIVVAE